MRGVRKVARLLILAMVTLCFAFSATAIWASSTGTADHGAEQATHAASADAHAEGAGGDGHGDTHGGSLSAEKLKDLGWRIMNFAVLVFLLVKFAAKPIGAGLSARRQQIKEEIEDLEAKKAAAEKSYREFEAKLAGVEKEIDTIVEKAIAQAEIEKAKIIERAEHAAADIKRQAEMTIQNEVMEAKRTLKNDVADQAAAMAEELIIKNLTTDDQVKIIEDYLAKVGAVQ